MERGLILIDQEHQSRKLLQEAVSLAQADDAELIILSLVDPSTHQDDAETVKQISDIEGAHYDDQTVVQAEERALAEHVESVMSSTGVHYECLVRVVADSKRAPAVQTVSNEYNCDHLFATGRRRSPTGKAVFGDLTQRLLLNYDGFVTVLLD
jgi:nucleotide-binding universal stress UspA family protein